MPFVNFKDVIDIEKVQLINRSGFENIGQWSFRILRLIVRKASN